MSGHSEPPGLLHRFVMGCIGFFIGTYAIYEGIQLIQAVWMWIAGIAAVVWIGVIVYKSKHEHW